MKRIVYRVLWDSRRRCWWIGINGRPRRADYATQREAVREAVRSAQSDHAQGRLAQVVLHGKNDSIRWERTYGRDPRRTRG